jgi:hypothetical protein
MNKLYIKNRSAFLKKAKKNGFLLNLPRKNDNNVDKSLGYLLYKEAEFVFVSSDFKWSYIRFENKYKCFCRVRNTGNNKEYNAELIVNGIIRFSFGEHLRENAGNINLKGKVEVYLFANHSKVDIFILQNELPPGADPSLNDNEIPPDADSFHNDYEEKDYSIWDDYDYEKDVFDALTDGQYGDYDEWDNNWDRLDDWRGG